MASQTDLAAPCGSGARPQPPCEVAIVRVRATRFRAVWENVYALALYDWNAVGLQGKQFSSVINRLTCQHAARVHSWVGRVEETRECW